MQTDPPELRRVRGGVARRPEQAPADDRGVSLCAQQAPAASLQAAQADRDRRGGRGPPRWGDAERGLRGLDDQRHAHDALRRDAQGGPGGARRRPTLSRSSNAASAPSSAARRSGSSARRRSRPSSPRRTASAPWSRCSYSRVCRIGEALGLTWEDIDFDGGFIRVSKQLDRKRQRVELKSSAGGGRLCSCPSSGSFCGSIGSRPGSRPRATSSSRHRTGAVATTAQPGAGSGVLVERAGLSDEGISAHSFRHTFASILIVGLKLDPARVAAQLGHATLRSRSACTRTCSNRRVTRTS